MAFWARGRASAFLSGTAASASASSVGGSCCRKSGILPSASAWKVRGGTARTRME